MPHAALLLVHEAEDCASVVAEPVEGAHHDRVPGRAYPRNAVSPSRETVVPVGPDSVGQDPGVTERGELVSEARLGGGQAGVARQRSRGGREPTGEQGTVVPVIFTTDVPQRRVGHLLAGLMLR